MHRKDLQYAWRWQSSLQIGVLGISLIVFPPRLLRHPQQFPPEVNIANRSLGVVHRLAQFKLADLNRMESISRVLALCLKNHVVYFVVLRDF